MDFVIVPYYMVSDAPQKIRFLSSPFNKARTFSDYRLHRACNHLATEGARICQRLRTWKHTTDYFSNATNLTTLSRFAVIYQEELLMAKKTTPTSDFKRAEWKGFLERPFTEQELFEADQWTLDDVGICEGVVSLTAEGYKLTVSYSAQTKACTATLMAGEQQARLSGWALSAKGADGRDALKLLCYKHYHLLGEDWLPLLDVGKRVIRG